ncbi:MAG: zinc-finger domain-containing protein [Gammaproteobacteria bacterium]|nr:zinc-finger domain-containing protein [Gammaproteobacteria bacterium]MDH3607836.1 zinc-finger domain-containing protein [Gammaproteobacteria bacterium]
MKPATSVVQIKPDDKEVACDGGGGALGHPMVYLPFGKKTHVECYYCGKRFEKSSPKK